MLEWWKKKIPLEGSVLFRGQTSPRAEHFTFLKKFNITLNTLPKSRESRWGWSLSHPDWGKAELLCLKRVSPPSQEVIEYAWLSDSEKDLMLRGETVLTVRLTTLEGHLLRDRKRLLFFMFAVMGDAGIGAYDHLSQKIWTREVLADELSHPADLDVEGLFAVHGIPRHDENRLLSIHSHGLNEIGAFDFNLLDPSDSLATPAGQEVFRSLAFKILETGSNPATYWSFTESSGDFHWIDLAQFMEQGSREHVSELKRWFDIDTIHHNKVLCEPTTPGLLERFLKGNYLPAHFFSEPLSKDVELPFSSQANELMIQRNKKTYLQLRALGEEFSEFNFNTLVKLACPVDQGGSENLWFRVNRLFESNILATLIDTPVQALDLQEGDRGRHPVDYLVDWVMITPVGSINPHSTIAARIVRHHRDELLAKLKAAEVKEDQL